MCLELKRVKKREKRLNEGFREGVSPFRVEVLFEHSSGGFFVETLERPARDVKAEAFGSGSGDAFEDCVIGRAVKPTDDLIEFVLIEAGEVNVPIHR
jgi:hypothetical protein